MEDLPCIAEALFLQNIRVNARHFLDEKPLREALWLCGEHCARNNEVFDLFSGLVEQDKYVHVLRLDAFASYKKEVFLSQRLHLHGECAASLFIEREQINCLRVAERD